MFTIEGKVVLLTGALGGLGRCFVRELLRNDVKGIALVDINDKQSDSFQKEIQSEFGDGKTIFLKVDLADATQIEDAYEKTVQHFQQLDIVINNAGMIGQNDFLKCLQTNFVATVYSTHLAFKKYLQAYRSGEEGVVINISSIAGLYPIPIFPAYSASKHGITAVGRCFGNEMYYNARKIKIMTICPGSTNTPIMDQLVDVTDDANGKATDLLEIFKIQRPESVATALIKVIKDGKSGSTWVSKNDQPAIEVDFSNIDETMYTYIS